MKTRSLADKRVALPRSSRVNHSWRQFPRPSKKTQWQLWLVPLIMGFLIVVVEIRDHQRMHQLHQSGQALVEDSELIREIILFGLILPLVSGFLLTYLKRVGGERDEAARTLEERRAFVRQVHDATNWQQLIQFVVAFPGAFVDATRAFLMVQRSQEESFRLVSSWYAQGVAPGEQGALIFPEVCQACAANASNHPVSAMACHQNGSENGMAAARRHCLWFMAAEEGKAALIFDVPAGQPLNDQKLQLLNDLGTEVAFAIANANLTYAGEKQHDAARIEQQRIARDLHDTLAQNISYLHLKLSQLSADDTLAGIVEVQREIMKMRAVASDAYHQVRNTLAELRSGSQSPLSEALQAYAQEVSGRADFSIEVHSRGQAGTLYPHVQRQVLYITREALNNVEKHANARHVVVNLSWVDQELTLQIADDGAGFHPDNVDGRSRYGLLIMEERARSLGGTLTVTSKNGGGTEVTLSLPLTGATAYDAERAKANQNLDR